MAPRKKAAPPPTVEIKIILTPDSNFQVVVDGTSTPNVVDVGHCLAALTDRGMDEYIAAALRDYVEKIGNETLFESLMLSWQQHRNKRTDRPIVRPVQLMQRLFGSDHDD